MRLRCGEERRDVTVRAGKGGLEVTVGGRLFRLRIEEVAPGTFLVKDGEVTSTLHCVRNGREVHLHWKGVVYLLTEEKDGGRAAHRASAFGLQAPMPGKVLAVRVEAGQRVAKGEELLVVEAMKMENALRAPRDGTVKAVHVREGETVNPASVLVELE
jgi:3-methylcrotonyl-CoA carboxylase alpha subunit